MDLLERLKRKYSVGRRYKLLENMVAETTQFEGLIGIHLLDRGGKSFKCYYNTYYIGLEATPATAQNVKAYLEKCILEGTIAYLGKGDNQETLDFSKIG